MIKQVLSIVIFLAIVISHPLEMGILGLGLATIILLAIVTVCIANNITLRKEDVEKALATLNDMVNKSQHHDALKFINKKDLLKYRYKLPPDSRRAVAEIEIDCLEKTGDIEGAVLSMSSFLASTYEYNKWPQDLYNRWIRLYNSIRPLPVEKFYFCSCCGLHPDEAKLLDSAISLGCVPPVGYPGKSGPAVLIELSPPQKLT